MLWHGIWGFKVNAAGERTDLVLCERIDAADVTRAERAGTALVLTEWKRITRQLTPKKAANQIETQVERYKRGSLAAVELRRVCYGVLVSAKAIPLPADRTVGDYTLRFVNVAVDPEVPSRARVGRAAAARE